MKFFIDTADTKEIQEAKTLGWVDGITTNPSLIAKTGRPWRDVVNEICKIVDGPISVETTTQSARELILEGEALSKINSNVVVKVALTEEGLKACKALTSDGIHVNVTLCFSASQALLAAK